MNDVYIINSNNNEAFMAKLREWQSKVNSKIDILCDTLQIVLDNKATLMSNKCRYYSTVHYYYYYYYYYYSTTCCTRYHITL